MRRFTMIVMIIMLSAASACQLLTAAAEPGSPRTLVLIGDEGVRNTHSQLLKSFEALGAQLNVRRSSNSSLQLRHWDTWLYGNVVLLHPSATELGGSLDMPHLVDFVDAGGNLLVALDSSASELMRELVSELGIDVEPTSNYVMDHFAAMPGDASHRTVLTSDFLASKALWGAREPQGPVVFNGIGMSVSPDSTMAKLALRGSATAYSATTAPSPRDNPTLGGSQVGLAAISQTRSDARTVVVGSLDALSDAAYGATAVQGSGTVAAGNADFGSALVRWLLHQRGVLRFGEFVHHRAGEVEPPHAYTIKDQVEFSVKVEELMDGEWKPYRASDVQLDFTMLDPHVRVFLKHNNEGTFSTAFQIPDVYGVFKWVIDYAAPGYNAIQLSQQNPVRPFKHTEYERFLSPAYPYYTAGITTMLAFTTLTVVFLYS